MNKILSRIEHKSFPEGLRWDGAKSSKEHPEEFLILYNILNHPELQQKK